MIAGALSGWIYITVFTILCAMVFGVLIVTNAPVVSPPDVRILFDDLPRRSVEWGACSALTAGIVEFAMGIRNRISAAIAAVMLFTASTLAFSQLHSRGCLSREMVSAINRDDVRAVHRLLASGADPQSCDWYDTDYLEASDPPRLIALAAIRGNWDIVEILAKGGADVNARGLGGTPVLTCAAINGRLDVVEDLVSLGARVNARSAHGETALAAASSFGCEQICVYLKAHGATR